MYGIELKSGVNDCYWNFEAGGMRGQTRYKNMKLKDEYIEVRQIIKSVGTTYGRHTQVHTIIEDQSDNLSEEFIDALYNDYGIELSTCRLDTHHEGIRPNILSFAKKMELVMKRHDLVKGDSWKDLDEEYLWDKLQEEFDEVVASRFSKELIDLANICMVLYHRRFIIENPELLLRRNESAGGEQCQ